MPYKRREFLKHTLLSLSAMSMVSPTKLFGSNQQTEKINVLVWDERQPDQKEAYANFLGNQIAGYLRNQHDFDVQSVGLDDPGQGLTNGNLDKADVLVWWGHIRQDEVKWETGQKIIDQVEDGTLSMIVLHSAHWSTPFMEAMNRITKKRAKREFPSQKINYVSPLERFTTPENDSRITPYFQILKYPDDKKEINVHLPYCCFPDVRNDGKPSYTQFTQPEHPIARGLQEKFEINQTEMYDEPYHVPEPDEVVLEERWANGEWFRSGMIWEIGRGRIFYFRPGHELYPIFKDERPLKILDNAIDWLNES